MNYTYFERDRSWLRFNRRVMDEARDIERVPLLERLRFLAIYSNNLDEFYATRVAFLQRIVQLSKRKQRLASVDNPEALLDEIIKETKLLNKAFEKNYIAIIRELRRVNIFIVNEKQLNATQQREVVDYYTQQMRTKITPVMPGKTNRLPLLQANSIYLAVVLRNKTQSNYALVEVPASIPRFYKLKARTPRNVVILSDDIIRFNLSKIFALVPHTEASAFTFKISRDAELDFNDDISHGVLENLNRTLKQRQLGEPVRLVYDMQMPPDLLQFLMQHFRGNGNELENNVPGMRYHNFRDFMNFPDFGNPLLAYQPMPIHPVSRLSSKRSLLDSIAHRDVLLAYPYHSFDNLIHVLQEAATDPNVATIYITFYRMASRSEVAHTLIRAVQNGKKVVVVIELKARFDEERNIEWSEKLSDAGLQVSFGFPNYKIHTKIILIERISQSGKQEFISHIGTGNFNERTSLVYQDLSLWTADQEIGNEIYQVFQFLVVNPFLPGEYKHLLVSPLNLRHKLNRMISREIACARRGRQARIMIKVNNLTDKSIIEQLYKASNAGVQIRIIARSNICLVPGVKNQSENIQVIRLVDRLLEHARIYWFSNNKRDDIYIGSADLMQRNLDNRVEVLVKLHDQQVRKQVRQMFEIQWKDTLKARNIDSQGIDQPSNEGIPLRSQYELSKYFAPKPAKNH